MIGVTSLFIDFLSKKVTANLFLLCQAQLKPKTKKAQNKRQIPSRISYSTSSPIFASIEAEFRLETSRIKTCRYLSYLANALKNASSGWLELKLQEKQDRQIITNENKVFKKFQFGSSCSIIGLVLLVKVDHS